MSIFEHCPICHQAAQYIEPKRDDKTVIAEIICPICGSYSMSLSLGRGSDLPKYDKILLAGLIREANEYGNNEPVLIQEEDIKNLIISGHPPKTKHDKIDKVLYYLSYLSEPGQVIDLGSILTIHQIISFCRDIDELHYYLNYLGENGLIEYTFSDTEQGAVPLLAKLKISGWSKIEELQNQKHTNQAFVAMSFDPSLKSLWENAIYKAVKNAGFEPYKIDENEHNEKICDLIMIEVKKSRFVIADITMHKKGVYFEAGYAIGLGIPVIWLCKDDKNEIENMHFDTRQYNHILWKDEEDLKVRLENRIKATII